MLDQLTGHEDFGILFSKDSEVGFHNLDEAHKQALEEDSEKERKKRLRSIARTTKTNEYRFQIPLQFDVDEDLHHKLTEGMQELAGLLPLGSAAEGMQELGGLPLHVGDDGQSFLLLDQFDGVFIRARDPKVRDHTTIVREEDQERVGRNSDG